MNSTVSIGPAGVMEFPKFGKKKETPVALPDDLSVVADGNSEDLPLSDPLAADAVEEDSTPVVVEPVVEERPEPVTLREAPKKIEVVEEDSEGVLYIYSENCLNCKHLFPKAKKIFNECHFTPNRKNKMKGNPDCPAQAAKIEIYLPIERAARAIVANTRSGNMSKVAKLYKKLEGYSEPQRVKCANRIAELLQETTSKKSGKKK